MTKPIGEVGLTERIDAGNNPLGAWIAGMIAVRAGGGGAACNPGAAKENRISTEAGRARTTTTCRSKNGRL